MTPIQLHLDNNNELDMLVNIIGYNLCVINVGGLHYGFGLGISIMNVHNEN